MKLDRRLQELERRRTMQAEVRHETKAERCARFYAAVGHLPDEEQFRLAREAFAARRGNQ